MQSNYPPKTFRALDLEIHIQKIHSSNFQNEIGMEGRWRKDSFIHFILYH